MGTTTDMVATPSRGMVVVNTEPLTFGTNLEPIIGRTIVGAELPIAVMGTNLVLVVATRASCYQRPSETTKT